MSAKGPKELWKVRHELKTQEGEGFTRSLSRKEGNRAIMNEGELPKVRRLGLGSKTTPAFLPRGRQNPIPPNRRPLIRSVLKSPIIQKEEGVNTENTMP